MESSQGDWDWVSSFMVKVVQAVDGVLGDGLNDIKEVLDRVESVVLGSWNWKQGVDVHIFV